MTNACRAGDKPVEQLAVENPAQRFRNQCDVRVWDSPPITQPTLPLSMGEYLSSVTVFVFSRRDMCPLSKYLQSLPCGRHDARPQG